MVAGIVGIKRGMTRIFDENGVATPVTVVEAQPNTVVQCKTQITDGYSAIQVSHGRQMEKRISKPVLKHYGRHGVRPGRRLQEIRLNSDKETANYSSGDQLTVMQFTDVEKVDVTSVSKGKGFQGAIKRWHFRGQDSTHGNSLSHRAPGSIGNCQFPGKVWKGKKMAGRMGNATTTTQNVGVVGVREATNVLLLRGPVPGPNGSAVFIKAAVKSIQK